MLHKVIALDTYQRLCVSDSQFKRPLEEGFEFEVDDERLETLLGNNKFNVPFVREIKKKSRKKSEE